MGLWPGTNSQTTFQPGLKETSRSNCSGPRISEPSRTALRSSLHPRVLVLDHSLVQLFEERRRLAQSLPHWQRTRHPGTDGARVIVGQRLVAASFFLVLARAACRTIAPRTPGTRAAAAPYGAGAVPGWSSGCPRHTGCGGGEVEAQRVGVVPAQEV